MKAWIVSRDAYANSLEKTKVKVDSGLDSPPYAVYFLLICSRPSFDVIHRTLKNIQTAVKIQSNRLDNLGREFERLQVGLSSSPRRVERLAYKSLQSTALSASRGVAPRLAQLKEALSRRAAHSSKFSGAYSVKMESFTSVYRAPSLAGTTFSMQIAASPSMTTYNFL